MVSDCFSGWTARICPVSVYDFVSGCGARQPAGNAARAATNTPVLAVNNPAVAQIDDAAAVGGVRLGVCDLNDRRALVIELLEQLHDLAALAGVQVACRFVCQNQ